MQFIFQTELWGCADCIVIPRAHAANDRVKAVCAPALGTRPFYKNQELSTEALAA